MLIIQNVLKFILEQEHGMTFASFGRSNRNVKIPLGFETSHFKTNLQFEELVHYGVDTWDDLWTCIN